MSEELEEYKEAFSRLVSENKSLMKEYSGLLVRYQQEKYTVFRPLARNFYRLARVVLRRVLPERVFNLIKRQILSFKKFPDVSGVPELPEVSESQVAEFVKSFTDAGPDVFICSIINWGFRFQRPQHLAKEIARTGRRVFFIEMEHSVSAVRLREVEDNLYVVRLSSRHFGHIQSYTGRAKNFQKKAWLQGFFDFCDLVKATAFKQIIIEHPYWWQFVRGLTADYEVIYDCMDDISGFSNTDEHLLELEHQLLRGCDKLIVSSQYLFDKYRPIKEGVLIRNGADFVHFSDEQHKVTDVPFLSEQEESTDRVRVGYVGAIAEWFDVDLLEAVALQEPNIDFHLCGSVTAKEPMRLEKIANVKLHGEIPYELVPAFVNKMDVLIIPFRLIPIIHACDPVKFYEYLSVGKPTVTTCLPELARAKDLAFFAAGAPEFAQKIYEAKKAGSNQEFVQKMKNYARGNTWAERTGQFCNVLACFPKVTVVILSYGDPNLTQDAIYSLYDGGACYPNMEVLVVDNGSPAEALQQLDEFVSSYPSVHLVKNNENLGFAKGNNIGLKMAQGEYVLLLNNDTFVAPGAIYAMARHLQANPEIGVVGPLTNNIGNEAKVEVVYDNMDGMKREARRVTLGYRGQFTPLSVLAYFSVMFRKSDLDKFGLLCEDYGRGMFEDDDHCKTILSQGYFCALAEDAFVHHHLSASFSQMGEEQRNNLFEENRQTYEKKWGPWLSHKQREKRPELVL